MLALRSAALPNDRNRVLAQQFLNLLCDAAESSTAPEPMRALAGLVLGLTGGHDSVRLALLEAGYAAGTPLPPILLTHRDGDERPYLKDGRHRLCVARMRGEKQLLAGQFMQAHGRLIRVLPYRQHLVSDFDHVEISAFPSAPAVMIVAGRLVHAGEIAASRQARGPALQVL